ncbi:MAG: helix-turn-helix domain-containing protein [Gammaproteobacteria bacterium]
MEKSYRVRSLTRGLRLLSALNARGSASLAQLVQDTGLAKPTAFRLLRTLLEEEYISKDDDTDAYRPAPRTCSLSSGFEENAWLVEHTRSELVTLGEHLVWPLSVCTLAGSRVLVRDNTDSTSPLSVRQLAPGMTLPILGSASGHVLLAYSSARDREQILSVLRASRDTCDLLARDTAAVKKTLSDVAQLGYSSVRVSRMVSELEVIAVPIWVNDYAIAALAVRFSAAAVPGQDIQDKFLPAMRDCAGRIGSAIANDERASPVPAR